MMKKSGKLLLMGMLCLPALLQAQSKTYTIDVKMDRKSNAVMAYLMYDDGKSGGVDSAVVKKGKFRFSGQIVDAWSAKLMVKHAYANLYDSDVLDLYVEAGKTTIVAGERIENAVISGSRINDQAKQYKQSLAAWEKETSDVMSLYRIATDDQRSDKEFNAGLQARLEKARDEQKRIRVDYIRQHPEQYLSLLIWREMLSYPFDPVMEALFNSLSIDVRKTERGQSIEKLIDDTHAYALGATAPDFTENDVNGKPVSLKNFRGKYVLLDFWASWCGPCRAENPNVVKVFNRFRDKNFTILSVSLDRQDSKKQWLSAIKEDSLEQWSHVSDLQFWDDKAVKLYGVKGVPENFLIGPDGKIIAKSLRGEALEKKLEELLGK